MAAEGDLRNLLRSEGRHHRGRESFFHVEHGADGGNHFGREEDPSDWLERDEDAATREELLRFIAATCTEEERRVLELMLAGQDTTAACTAALGISHLLHDEQARQVKQVKDRLKKRISRRRKSA
jgi:hypothetical protein